MDWNRLEQLVEEASDLPADRRASLLREHCSDDAELLGEALSLLEHVEPAEHYFSALGADLAAPAESAGGLKPSDRVGPYELVEPLGEGGMGRVWLAEQSEPVKRRVALKVIKVGIDTREVVARFAAERQALAVMDHPGIARVFDAGTTDDGRPYFVMEAIRGVPITEYCDNHRLDTQERIRLFIRVCDAVQHAHLKGVVHRDLKPSNMLVAEHESGPIPKVIDFGVAKAVGEALTDKTLVTSLGQMVGTPAYMSPEQAEQSGLDVDSRTDVYALGVVLYELLVGALPFARETLRKPALVLQSLLRDMDLPSPSARLSDLDDTQVTVAAARATDVRTLRRHLRGDLDWVVMKAMEKDRTRRYETANALAQDLQRYLGHEPVVARPPTAAYELRRFVRRNRVAVVGTAATIAVLMAGIVGTSVGLVRANQAEAEARRAQFTAEQEAETSEAMSRFLTDLFGASFPGRAMGTEWTAREILDRGADRVRTELRDQPVVQARLMHTIGRVYGQLSLREQSVDLLEEALTIQERELGPNHAEVAATLVSLARYLGPEGGTDRSERLYRRAWAIYDRAEGPRSRSAVTAQNMLAILLTQVGRYEEAADLYEGIIGRLESRPDQDEPMPDFDGRSPRQVAALIRKSLADIRLSPGRVGDAEAEYRATLATLRTWLPADHPDVALTLRQVGRAYILRGQPEEAYATYEQVLGSLERVFGEWHVQTANALMDLGHAAELVGRLDEAEAHHRRALAITDSLRGPESAASGQAYWNLGNVALRRGDFEAAESSFRRALRLRQQAVPPGHSTLGQLRGRLAEALEGQGRVEEAAELAEEGLEIMESHLGAGSSRIEYETHLAARLRLAQGDTAAAEAMMVQVVERAEAAKGESAELVNALDWLSNFYADIGRRQEARDVVGRALDFRQRVADPSSAAQSGYTTTLQGLCWRLGGILGDLGDWDAAAAVLAEAVTDYDQTPQPTLDQTVDVVFVLKRQAAALGELGRYEDAKKATQRAADIERRLEAREDSSGPCPSCAS